MKSACTALACRLLAAGLSLATLGACSTLRPTATPPPSFYALEAAAATTRREVAAAAPTLIVSPPHAAAGFDSSRIIYVRERHKIEYFAHSEWVDPPARMLAPLLLDALENSGAFRAVVAAPSAASGELRLDTEILRLQHEFGTRPSRVRFSMRAYVVENATRQVLAWREFDESAPAASEDPYGGVVAANRAVQAALARLAQFCAETAAAQSARR